MNKIELTYKEILSMGFTWKLQHYGLNNWTLQQAFKRTKRRVDEELSSTHGYVYATDSGIQLEVKCSDVDGRNND